MGNFITTCLCSFISCTALAADLTETNKSEYWLFHPTPPDVMRPLTTDGTLFISPHTPYTIDAGHVQLENNVFYAYESHETDFGFGNRDEASFRYFGWVPALRLGLCNRVDFKIAGNYYNEHAEIKMIAPGLPSRVFREFDAEGFANTPLSLKINLCGNDRGSFVLALEPFVLAPTAVGKLTDVYGFNVPFEFKLTDSTRLRMMSGFEFNEDTSFGRTAYTVFREMAQLRQTLWDKFDIYGEFTARLTDRSTDWTGTAGFGVAYRFCPHFEWQLGSDFDFEALYPFDYILNSVITARF